MARYMLSTIDNPYNPWLQWDEWYAWDAQAGYHTPGYLARIAVNSDELSESDQDLADEQAIDEIVRENILGVYTKVSEPVG